MKKLLSIVLVLLLLCGCSGGGNNGGSKNGGELFIFMPGEYISDDVINSFEKETGIKVSITTFDSNESMYTKLLGGTVYDIIIPSDYMIERLIAEEMVQPLDKSKLQNLGLLYDQVLNMVGICYDRTLIDEEDVKSQGWDVLRNTKYKGMIYMYDSIRDAFMMAEKALGYSMNTDKEEELNAAYEWLLDIAVNMDPAYVTDEAIDGLATGEKAMGMMYSGDAALIALDNENIAFWAPTEGTNYFVDAMVIHKDAKNVENAYKFIDFITDYDAAYENSVFVGYSSANAEALKAIAEEDYAGIDAYIPRDKTAKDEVFHNNEEVLKTISELWVKVKNTK